MSTASANVIRGVLVISLGHIFEVCVGACF